MDLEIKIKVAQQLVDEKSTELTEAKRHLKSLELERVKQKYGIGFGDIVSSSRNTWKKHKLVEVVERFKVSRIETWPTDRPSLEGYKIKKDGTPSKREQYIGTNWEVVT